MRRIIIFVVLAILLAPLLSRSERVYLKDGSVIRGTVTRMAPDSVYLKASFGSLIALARSEILRIEFTEGEVSRRAGETYFGASAPPGSLHVYFDSEKFSSKVVIHREQDRSKIVRANGIEEAFFVDNIKVFSYVDSTEDKLIREGPDKIYKNTIILKDIKVELKAGPHRCRFVVGNLGKNAYSKHFENKPLYRALELGDIIIYPGKTTNLYVNLKKKKWSLGR